MRLLIQRVSEASVTVDEKVVGSIQEGVLVFLGIHKDDRPEDTAYLAQKLTHLRLFKDTNDKMNLSLKDTQGSVLIISQFTLYANCSSGRRPDFFCAAPPKKAKPLYEKFIKEVKQEITKVETGIFGAHMRVHLINDGPVTFILDSK